MVNARSLVDVVQQPVGRQVGEGVVHDPGDQLGELAGDLRPHLELQGGVSGHLGPGHGSHLLNNLLAVIIQKFIDGVG